MPAGIPFPCPRTGRAAPGRSSSAQATPRHACHPTRAQATGCNPRKFVELDLPAVTRRKARCIAAAPLLKAALASSAGEEATQVDHGEGNGVSVTAAAYALCPCDIGDPAAVDAALTSAGIDRS